MYKQSLGVRSEQQESLELETEMETEHLHHLNIDPSIWDPSKHIKSARYLGSP